MQLLAINLIKSNGRLVNLTHKHIRSRLAEALILIHNIYGTNTKTGNLSISLKRSELAELANMTTSNCIRVLSSFKKEKIVDINNRSIKLNDLEFLKQISESAN